jgi:hypothetical protein
MTVNCIIICPRKNRGRLSGLSDGLNYAQKNRSIHNSPKEEYRCIERNKEGLCYEFTKLYEPDPNGLNTGVGAEFDLCWKFIPPGVYDNVTATLPADFDWANLKFITTNQTEISYTAPATGSTVELNLPGGSEGTEYSLHAVYNDGGVWKQIGRMQVMSRSLKTFNVVIVPVETGISVEKATIEANLNKIYEKYGIRWTVNVDTEFASKNTTDIENIVGDIYQLIAGDNFLSVYSSQQLILHRLYKKQTGYNNENPIVFLFTKRISSKLFCPAIIFGS